MAMKKIKNFCTLEIYQSKVLLHVKLNPDDYELSDILKDVRSIGHWGCGDLQLTIKSRLELELAKKLIFDAYDNN